MLKNVCDGEKKQKFFHIKSKESPAGIIRVLKRRYRERFAAFRSAERQKRIKTRRLHPTGICIRSKRANPNGRGFTRLFDNIVAYCRAINYPIAPLNRYFTRTTHYGIRGFYVRKDNYLTKLPLFAAKMVPLDNWYEKDVYATTSDGGDAYTKDKDFLKSCLIYTCLSNQNKCLSFDGSDGKQYQNELCFDDSRDEKPLALQDLQKYAASEDTALDGDEKELIDLWKQILEEAKKTSGYKSEYNYGVYQITKELNTSYVVGAGKNKKVVYDNPVLNGHLESLLTKLKAYYKSHITAKMFKYELLK